MRFTRPSITLRLRVALFSGAILLATVVALVLFINIAATVTTPSSQTAGVPLTLPLPQSGEQGGVAQATQNPAEIIVAGPTVTPMEAGAGTVPVSYSLPETERIRQTVLGQLQLISAIGLLIVIFLGSLAAYWAAGKSLSPLTRISNAAKAVSANNLDTRLSLKAPDEEIRELGDAFDTMMERLHYSFDQQGQFVSNAAHELRNPIATLHANVEVAQLGRVCKITTKGE